MNPLPDPTHFRVTLRTYLKAERGRTSALARHLGCHTSDVYRWLTGKAAPDHRRTLAILRWLPEEMRREIVEG